jgi:acyl-coenzyme A synthetase/AMP-(fatty) acid ligase
MHIVDMIYYWARVAPLRPAVIQASASLTFRELVEGIDAVAEQVKGLDLNKQECVGVAVLSPMLMLQTIFALLRDGYSVAPIGGRHVSEIGAASGITTVISDGKSQFGPDVRTLPFDPTWLATSARAGPRTRAPKLDSYPDLIFFTSGTTGLPKKVVQPIEALNERLRSPLACGVGPYQKFLMLPGLTTTFGFNFSCEALNFGKTVCYSFLDRALDLINVYSIDVIVLSAAQAIGLTEMKAKRPGARVDTLKAVFIGGGKVDPEGIARIRGSLCRNVINDYGSTEAGTALRSPFDALDDAAGGVPLPWVEIEVVDEEDQRLATGAEGIIRLKTPQLEQAVSSSNISKANIRDRWFYPGDIGALDADGSLRLAGRSSDVINRGGLKVSGRRIEEIVKALPQVNDAAACAVIGASGLEEIWVAIVEEGDVDMDGLKNLLLSHQDIQTAPDEIIVLNDIPRSELGKVQAIRLKEAMFAAKGRT